MLLSAAQQFFKKKIEVRNEIAAMNQWLCV